MKKLILLVIVLIALSGCTVDTIQQGGTGSLKAELKEEIKAELKGDIKDELKEELKTELKQELKEELTEELKETSGSLELTADYCLFADMPGYFQCRWGFLWKDGVEFKIRYQKSNPAVLKSIWFTELDCGMGFPEEDKYNMEYMDELLLDIPCNITKDSFYNNEIEITMDEHRQSQNRTYSINEVVAVGRLGGIVRDRETLKSDSKAKVSVVEECDPPAEWAFSCTQHRIAQDYIDIRLKVDEGGLYVVKKIEFPAVPCEYEPGNISKESGFTRNEERVYHIPCVMKREFVKSMLEITYDYYPETRAGEYSNTPQQQLVAGGWIAGMIK